MAENYTKKQRRFYGTLPCRLSKDEIRWYLRTNASSADEDAEHIRIGAFTLTAEDAKTYLYSFSTKRRVYNWKDLNVTVWI